MPTLSVVIPTYNSSRTLSACLDSVKNQTEGHPEIVIVDRFSNDRSIEIAKKSEAKIIQTESNRSIARNIGLKHATSEGVLFIDSDMILPPNLLEECSKGLEVHDALVIPEASVGTGFWAKCKALERETYIGSTVMEAARCFRRRTILSLGGYNAHLEAGEDWDLHNRSIKLGLSLGRTKACILHDEGDLKLASVLKKKYEYGRTVNEYMAIYPESTMRQLNPFRRIAGPAFVVIPRDPVHGVGIFLMKALEFSAAFFGRVAGRLGPAQTSRGL